MHALRLWWDGSWAFEQLFLGIYRAGDSPSKSTDLGPRFASLGSARTPGRLPSPDLLDEIYDFRGVSFAWFGLLKGLPAGPPFCVVDFDGA